MSRSIENTPYVWAVIWAVLISLATSGAITPAAATVPTRYEVSLSLTVRVKFFGISQESIPFDKLVDFLEIVLPESDLPRKDRGGDVDASLRFRYDISSASFNEFTDLERFIKEEGLHDGSSYRIQRDKLDSFLQQVENVQPSFLEFTVIVVHSDSLPRHLIFDTDPSRCIQSFASNLAFVDLSAAGCDFSVPKRADDVSAQVQFHTPIFHHPWPGTFALDKTTRWTPVPTTDILNHRIARIGGIIASAARTFGSSNYASLLVNPSRPFFIPVICFQNGAESEYVHFSIDKVRELMDRILPLGHRGHVLAVSYGVEEIPEAALAVTRSRSYNHSFKINQYGEESSTEYAYYDGNFLWEHLSPIVTKLTEDLKHTMVHSMQQRGETDFDASVQSFPVVILSDFHQPASAEKSALRVQPLFENDDTVMTVESGKVTFALHSTVSDLMRIVKASSGSGWSWKPLDLTSPDALVFRSISKLISGLTTPEMQQYDSFNVIDATWLDTRDITLVLENEDSLGVWNARRSVAMARLHGICSDINKFADRFSLTVNRLKRFQESSVDRNVSLSEVLGQDLKNFVFPGLDHNSFLFPQFGKLFFPPEAVSAFEDIEKDATEIDVVISKLRDISSSSKSVSFTGLMSVLEDQENTLRSLEAKVGEELRGLLGILKTCTVSYEAETGSQDYSTILTTEADSVLLWYVTGGSAVVLVLCAFAVRSFIKYVEARAKKLA